MGIRLSGSAMRSIDTFLDFPRIGYLKLGHRSIHNPIGIALAGMRWGPEGAKYAASHILLDMIQKEVRKIGELR